MLSLTRIAGQSILIGDNIRVKVTQVNTSNGKVCLAIEAPRSVAIDREEVRERKDRS